MTQPPLSYQQKFFQLHKAAALKDEHQWQFHHLLNTTMPAVSQRIQARRELIEITLMERSRWAGILYQKGKGLSFDFLASQTRFIRLLYGC